MGRDDRAGTRPRDAGQVPFGVGVRALVWTGLITRPGRGLGPRAASGSGAGSAGW